MTQAAPIKLLTNATELILLLANEGSMSPAEIADQLGLPRSSVYRLIDGLTAIDMCEKLPDARVRLSSRWLGLADVASEGMKEWAGARAELHRLVEATGQTAYLSVPRENRAFCIEWVQGRGIDLLVLKPGGSLPLYAGAAGRTLLAYSENPEALLEAAPFDRLTPGTLTTAEELRADIANTLAQGFTASEEDVTAGIGAIGVPVLGPSGTAIATLSMGGLNAEFKARREEFVAELQASAAVLAASALIRT